MSQATLRAALGGGTARSWVLENWEFLTVEWANSQPGGAAAVADIVTKDLLAVLEACTDLDVGKPLTSAAAEVVPGFLGGR